MEINVFNYIPENSRVFLTPNFRAEIFTKAIKIVGTKRKLSKLLDTNESTIYDWKVGRKRPPLNKVLKLGHLLGISDCVIRNNILWMTSYLKNGRISVKNWKIKLNDKFTEFIGFVRGDGTITLDYIGLFNNNLEVIMYFIKFLQETFSIEKRRVEITIRYDNNTNIKELDKAINFFKEKGFLNIHKLKEEKGTFKRIGPNIKVRILSRLLSRFLSKINEYIYQLIENSPKEVKIGYIRGFMIAEGSVYVSCGRQRAISISQKGIYELIFIRNLLSDIGIHHVSLVPLRNEYFQIVITTRRKIENFRNIVGFGIHKKKQNTLAEVINGYKQDLAYYKINYSGDKLKQELQGRV